jgi:hypothetical protein
MIVTVMQPYFFPYIGYFQLIALSDIFVFHDAVQYMKGSWINRNLILDSTGKAAWLTLPVAAGSHRLEIRERMYVLDDGNTGRLRRRVENAYIKMPRFHGFFPLFEQILDFPEQNVAEFNINLLISLARQLGLCPRFARSSEIPNPEGLTGQARVIDICSRLRATHYINPIGGVSLYDAAAFRNRGVTLGFLQPIITTRDDLYPYLSIIHTFMAESDTAIAEMLGKYRIISAISTGPSQLVQTAV